MLVATTAQLSPAPPPGGGDDTTEETSPSVSERSGDVTIEIQAAVSVFAQCCLFVRSLSQSVMDPQFEQP